MPEIQSLQLLVKHCIAQVACWSSGMILASGARVAGFDFQTGPLGMVSASLDAHFAIVPHNFPRS